MHILTLYAFSYELIFTFLGLQLYWHGRAYSPAWRGHGVFAMRGAQQEQRQQ